jgi:hypothetical protein
MSCPVHPASARGGHRALWDEADRLDGRHPLYQHARAGRIDQAVRGGRPRVA